MRSNPIGTASLLWLLCLTSAAAAGPVTVKAIREPHNDTAVQGGRVTAWSLKVTTILRAPQRVNVITTNAADLARGPLATRTQTDVVTVSAGSAKYVSVFTWGARPSVRTVLQNARAAAAPARAGAPESLQGEQDGRPVAHAKQAPAPAASGQPVGPDQPAATDGPAAPEEAAASDPAATSDRAAAPQRQSAPRRPAKSPGAEKKAPAQAPTPGQTPSRR